MKLHDIGLENQFFTSDDVYMLGYGCVVPQYPQFYDRYLDNHQGLPRPYLESFEGYPGYKSIKEKWVLYLGGKAGTFV